tara:strand:- start:207 stop:383 length:177 start_codon:yes stop_codon:yes gene_type:complete
MVIKMLKEIEELIEQKVLERTAELNEKVKQLIIQLHIFNDIMNGAFEDVTEEELPPWV